MKRMIKPRSFLLLMILMIILLPVDVRSQAGFKKRRDIKEDIGKCSFLQAIKENEWKQMKEGFRNIEDKSLKLGERKDYEFVSALFHDKEYIFGLQVTHLDLPRWVLLINDTSDKKPVYRYSGLIKQEGFDVDQIALSMNRCSTLNMIAPLEPEIGVQMRAYGVLYKRIDELMINENCKGESYQKIDCGGIDGIGILSSSQQIIQSTVCLIEESPFGLMLTAGECSPYQEMVVDALRYLYKTNTINQQLFLKD